MEIVGLEFGGKSPSSSSSSSHISDNHLLTKSSNTVNDRKVKLTKVDQTLLQVPRRTTFIANRKIAENVFPRYREKVKFYNLTSSLILTIMFNGNGRKIEKEKLYIFLFPAI